MTIIGVIGILLGLAALPFAFIHRTRLRLAVFFTVWLVQLVSTVVYFQYAQTAVSDSAGYYDHLAHLAENGFGFGTQFVILLTQWLKVDLGATYLDCFFVFQNSGFFGIVLMMRIFEEMFLELDIEQPGFSYIIFFVPSLHFWTASIGKDGPLMMAVAMAVWAVMRLRARWMVLAAAIGIMLLFRPHIGLATVMALAAAIFFERRVTTLGRAALVLMVLIGGALAAATVETAFAVDVTSADSLSNFFEAQSEAAQQFDMGSAVLGASFPFRLFSLLFRPFFIDAEGVFGVIASLENLFIVLVLGTILLRLPISYRVAREVLYLRFAIIFTAVIILLLAIVYYNVGLGLRQRSMMMPALFTFFVAVLAVRRARFSAVARPAVVPAAAAPSGEAIRGES